jgi:CBS domain-containing protein
MSREFEVVRPDCTIEEVARRLEARPDESFPVCEYGRLIGLVSYRDVVVRAPAIRRALGVVRVRDVISPEVLFCFEHTLVSEAATLMRDSREPRIPVLDADRRLVGMLALSSVPLEAGGAPGSTALSPALAHGPDDHGSVLVHSPARRRPAAQ